MSHYDKRSNGWASVETSADETEGAAAIVYDDATLDRIDLLAVPPIEAACSALDDSSELALAFRKLSQATARLERTGPDGADLLDDGQRERRDEAERPVDVNRDGSRYRRACPVVTPHFSPDRPIYGARSGRGQTLEGLLRRTSRGATPRPRHERAQCAFAKSVCPHHEEKFDVQEQERHRCGSGSAYAERGRF